MSSIYLIIVVVMVAINAETKQCAVDSTCECTKNETCILQCIGDQACKNSGTHLKCKSGYPCTIICDSDGNTEACLDTVIHTKSASNITLNCTGNFACKTVLYCGDATHCDTICAGDSACLQTKLFCDNSQCSIDCHAGSSNTCKDIYINKSNAVSFSCYNDCSDPGIPNDFSNITLNPTKSPTGNPSITPTKSPIKTPTTSPSKISSLSPTPSPTSIPTKNHLPSPTSAPTQLPTLTSLSTSRPTVTLTTSVPTRSSNTANQNITPTTSPSILPTRDTSSITYTTPPTKSPATAYPTISSSENPTINPTKLPSVIPSVSSTNKSILTTTEKPVQESNENDISYLGLGMPLWMNAVIGFGIICCLLIVLMLCIRKRNKKSYVNFESPDVNENDEQIVVRTDTHETHSNNSIKAEFNMGDLGASNSNLCEKNTFERGLMNNCVVSDILMEEIVDNMDTRGNIEMSNNNNNIVAAQGEAMDIQDSIEDINNNINDEQVMLQEIIKMANDTKVTAEGDNNI